MADADYASGHVAPHTAECRCLAFFRLHAVDIEQLHLWRRSPV
jgi:hypothetical protein